MSDFAALGARLDRVRERLASAASRARRDPASVRLVAISKTFSIDHIRAAADFGQVDFGENKIQEAVGKMTALSTTSAMSTVSATSVRWHFIGHLQSNKARKAAEHFDAVHSVDTAALLVRLDEAARAAGRTIDVLVQVDLGGEATKHGVPPEGVAPILTAASGCTAARVAGLMTIPPAADDPEVTRPYFRRLRELRDQLLIQGIERTMLKELSMGMSHDFEVAVEEGATLVRVGSAIFGERHYV